MVMKYIHLACFGQKLIQFPNWLCSTALPLYLLRWLTRVHLKANLLHDSTNLLCLTSRRKDLIASSKSMPSKSKESISAARQPTGEQVAVKQSSGGDVLVEQ
ncbi:hypothetical protein Tco_1375181 [Tanacetum coccineum]